MRKGHGFPRQQKAIWWEYEEGIPSRTQGKNLDRELCVRMKGVSGEYHMERCRDMPLETIRKEVEFFRGYGIRMAMDDYGTGSASSGIVLHAPMDEIKLDMSFIRGITEDARKQAMVRSIVEFANSCGMSTCLEGVETEELQNYLRIYRAIWFQGYYYSRPIEIRKFREMVQAFGGKRNQRKRSCG